MSNNPTITIVRHWLPIVTRCPLSPWPDLIYISVEFPVGMFAELYEVRKTFKKEAWGKTKFMEIIASDILDANPTAAKVTVSLLFNRHTAIAERKWG